MAEKCTERVALDAEKNMKYNVEVLTKESISINDGATPLHFGNSDKRKLSGAQNKNRRKTG